MARQFREQLEEEIQLEETRRTQAKYANAEGNASTDSSSGTAAGSTPDSQSAAATQPAAGAAPEPAVSYPDTYSHAHPTDSLGRPIDANDSSEPAAPVAAEADTGQQDWVKSLSGTENPTQDAANAAYARSHERGT